MGSQNGFDGIPMCCEFNLRMSFYEKSEKVDRRSTFFFTFAPSSFLFHFFIPEPHFVNAEITMRVPVALLASLMLLTGKSF